MVTALAQPPAPLESYAAVDAAATPNPLGLRRTRRALDRIGDRGLLALTALAAFLAVAVIAAIIEQVAQVAWPAISHWGIAFVWHSTWNPVTDVYGARWYIIGTLITAFGALLIAAPLSIAIGLFLSELAPPAIRGPIGSLVDMLAAVPSVVIGLWGIYVLLPFCYNDLEPWLHSWFGFIPIFGQPGTDGMFPAMLVLAIMATPITSSICRELFVSVPEDLEEAAIGLGATRWETVKGVIVPQVKGGVVAATILGLGRALGEAIAVTQVIGNGVPIRLNIFQPGVTLASQLANQYSSSISPLFTSSLLYLALILLVITFAANVTAQRIVHRFDRQRTGVMDGVFSLQATGRSRRRLRVNRAVEAGLIASAVVAVGVLALLVGSVLVRGLPALNLNLITEGPSISSFGVPGGGILPAIVGTLMLVLIAAAISVPIGVLSAIFVSEFAPKHIAAQVRLWLDVLSGFPSIVIGIFVFALAVQEAVPLLGIGHHQSAWAGGFALAIIMLPLVSRTTMEVLALVPNSLREASYALGISKWRTVLSIVLPSAISGIVTGTTLAVARVAGETAPLLFTCTFASQNVTWNPATAVSSIPFTIFSYSESPSPGWHAQAWAAAFLLIAFVLVTSLTARVFLDRSRRKLGQV